MTGKLELFDSAGTPVPAGRAVDEERPAWLINPRVLRWETATFTGVAVLKAIVECPDRPSGVAALTEGVSAATVAGYSKTRDALASISSRLKTTLSVQSSGRYSRGNPERVFLTREGVNRLILDSTKPEAARLKDWLAEDVMPAIEDTGGYIAPGAGIALPDLSKGSLEVIEFVGRLGEAAAAASRTALVAMQQVQQLEAARAEDAPLVEQARHHRSTRALTAIGDFANDLQDWARDEGINATVYHDDVRDYLGHLKLIIRGNTVRNNRPQSEAIKAGYVRPHNHDFGTSARLTRKGVGYVWDRITPHIKATGSAKPPAKSDGDAA